MIQIFGTTKNFDTKKAQMWFKERRIPFQFVDLKEKEMSRGEFESVVESVSRAAGSRAEAVELLADKNSKDYASFAYLDDSDKEEKLFENQLLHNLSRKAGDFRVGHFNESLPCKISSNRIDIK